MKIWEWFIKNMAWYGLVMCVTNPLQWDVEHQLRYVDIEKRYCVLKMAILGTLATLQVRYILKQGLRNDLFQPII